MRFLLTIVTFLLFTFSSLYAQEENSVASDGLIQLPPIDSLLSTTPTDSVQNKVESIEAKLSSLEDSLEISTQFPDSLLPQNLLDPITHKADSVELKLNAFADSLKNKVQIPDSLKKFLPKQAGLLNDQQVPDLKIEELDQVKELEEDLPGLNDVKQVGEIKDATNLEGLKEINPLKETGEFKEIENISKKAGEIKEISNKTNNLSETAENEAQNLKGIKALEEQKGELGEYEQELGEMKDQDYFKEKAVDKATEVAKDHFAGHMDKLQAAQEKLAGIKKKYPEGVSSIKDLPKRRPNPMKGKPFKERLLLGLTVQIYRDQTPNVDLSPFAAYKLSEKLSWGLGGNYRLMTKDNFRGFTQEGAVYGYRTFAEFKIRKGIFAHAEYEIMRVPIKDSLMLNVQEKVLGRGWVDGLLVGMGKDYKIARYINGNMQVLYNFLNEGNSPYQNKVMVRFGFSFRLKDKIKKPEFLKEVKSSNLKSDLKKEGDKVIQKKSAAFQNDLVLP